MTGARAATLNDVDAMADVLVRAFHDDPLMAYLFQTDEGRRKKSRLFFVSDAKRAIGKAKGRVDTNDDDGGEGRLRSGSLPTSGAPADSSCSPSSRCSSSMGRETPRALDVLNQVEKVHPKQPHWYLAVLGTDPEHQGKGVGSGAPRAGAREVRRGGHSRVPGVVEGAQHPVLPTARVRGHQRAEAQERAVALADVARSAPTRRGGMTRPHREPSR